MENLTNDIKRVENNNEIEDNPEIKAKKMRNINIYKIYRILSFDLLFYYAVIYLFLCMEKGFNAAQILQVEAFYILFKSILQIPSTLLIQRVGKRRSIIIANFITTFHILVMMFAPDFKWLLFSQFLCAFGFGIKSTCETDLLYDSVPHGEKRGSQFAKIDGKATARHYYLEALSSVLSGFLFVINPYLPIILCFIILLITSFISIKFEDIQEKKKHFKVSEELKKIKYSFRDIFKSRRLISLLIFNAIMVGIIKIMQNLRNTVLIEIGMPEQYFGIIFAALEIISGIGSKNQDKIHKRYRNKTLTAIAYPMVITCIIMGFVLMFDLKFEVLTTIIFILFAMQYVVRGPYYVLIKRYLNNFTNSDKRVKIATANNLIENIIASILIFLASFVTDMMPINITLIFIGCVLTVIVVLMLEIMRTTVGLKQEQYTKKELMN